MDYGQIKQSKIDISKVRSKVLRRTQYSASYFGFENIQGDGKHVRLCVIDSGFPSHIDIRCNEDKCKNFTDTENVYDTFGHSTAVTGIIAANNKSAITGLATETDLYFAKIIQDNYSVNTIESVIEAILWSIVRDVDMILMSFGVKLSMMDYMM
jgi:subtilisin family serine protease